MRLTCALVVGLLAVAARANAQTIEAQRFRLAVGPCVISSGSGAPSAGTGNTCDSYFNATTGDLWVRIAGVWKKIGDIGSGTPGTVAKWATSSTLQDSLIAETASGAIVNEAIGSPGYASQVAGWQITPAGNADVRYLFTNELRAKIFTADAESVLAGSERVTKSYSTIAQPFVCPLAGADSPLWVKDAASYGDAPVFQTNDWIVIHTLTRTTFGPFTIADCVGSVTGYVDGSGTTAGQQSWVFTRGAGANSGSMTGGTTVPVDQLAQDLGVSGNGYVETTALDGVNNANAPYMQVVTWTGAPTSSNLTARCRYGKITGMTGIANEYGFLCGDLTGPGHYIRMSNLVAEVRDIALNLFDASSNRVIALDPSGPSFAMGNPIPTSYAGVNSGLWMGNDGGTYKIRIGGQNGNRLQWDGITLTVAGEGSGVTNINGGNIQTGTVTAAKLLITGAGAALNHDPTFADNTAWSFCVGSARVAGSGNGHGAYFLQGPTATGAATTCQISDTGLIPIDRNKTYRLSGWGLGSANANGTFVIGIQELDQAGTTLLTQQFPINPGVVPTTWTFYTAVVSPFNASTVWVRTTAALNYNGTAGYQAVADLRLEEMAPSTLIQDGAITTVKVAAQAITAGQIAAGTITTGQIAASTILGGNIAGGTITGANIAAGSITAGNIAAGSFVSVGGAAGDVNAGTTTISGGKITTGSITATQIAAGTIVAGNMNVTALSAITANLGSVTAGSLSAVSIGGSTVTGTTITGSTVTAGCATMDSNGFTLTPGASNTCNWYKWTSGGNTGMYTDGGAWMGLQGPNIQLIAAVGSNLYLGSDVQLHTGGSMNVNGPSGRLMIDGNGTVLWGANNSQMGIESGGTAIISALGHQGGVGHGPVCRNDNGELYTQNSGGPC